MEYVASVNASLALITSILKPVSWAIQLIDKYMEMEKAHIDAIEELKNALTVLERYTLSYEIRFNQMLSGQGVAMSFPEGPNAQSSLDDFKRKLQDTKDLFEQFKGPVESQNPSIQDLVYWFIGLNSSIENVHLKSIKSKTEQVEKCRGYCANAYELVWHLYLIHQFKPSSRNDAQKYHEDLGQALDEVEDAFNKSPFSLYPTTRKKQLHKALLYLNQNYDHVERLKDCMIRCGSEWVKGELNRPESGTHSKCFYLDQLQARLFTQMWSGAVGMLKGHGNDTARSGQLLENVSQLVSDLERFISTSARERILLGFFGMTKAGKSTFLNALIGQSILPSDDLPSTAWPCRIRHVPGQALPKLTFKSHIFRNGIKAIREAGFGARLRDYRTSSKMDDPTQLKLMELDSRYAHLHKETKANLSNFEDESFTLPEHASGLSAVKKLLGQLNDIIRLCHFFGLNYEDSPDWTDLAREDLGHWPLVTTEFYSLKGHHTDGIYEFVDTPGVGEHDIDDRRRYERLVRVVLQQSDVAVPVISLTHALERGWREELGSIIGTKVRTQPSAVVCTRLDQFDKTNSDARLDSVRREFWPKDMKIGTPRAIACSSIVGMGALRLLDASRDGTPSFDSFWDRERKPAEYSCASRILGIDSPKEVFELLHSKNLERWREALDRQMESSGLSKAIQALSRDLVDQAKQETSFHKRRTIQHHILPIAVDQARRLLELRRSEADFRQSNEDFLSSQKEIYELIHSWNNGDIKNEYGHKVGEILDELKQRNEIRFSQSIQAAANQEPEHLAKEMKEEDNSPTAELKNLRHARRFLTLVQIKLKEGLYQDETWYSRKLGQLLNQARKSVSEALKAKISHPDLQVTEQLRKNIIAQLEPPTFRQLDNTVRRRNLGVLAVQELDRQPKLEPLRSKLSEEEYIAILPFLLGDTAAALVKAFRFPLTPIFEFARVMTTGIKYLLDVHSLKCDLQTRVFTPWLEQFETRTKSIVGGTISLCTDRAIGQIEDVLKKERLWYKREGELRQSEQTRRQPQAVALMANLWAIESALDAIQQSSRSA